MINRILRKNAEKLQLKLNSMKILSANYIDDYKVQLIFDDKKKNVINFLPVLKKNSVCKKYLDITKFKKFKLDQGYIVWGKNWDMIFTIESLYNNTLN
ncbi:MAG: DUF2442 domain-containing protein [Bacteroidetes bacterium]|nr:DUF2442 domain-containing protein [Bacteroidota bacterium]